MRRNVIEVWMTRRNIQEAPAVNNNIIGSNSSVFAKVISKCGCGC